MSSDRSPWLSFIVPAYNIEPYLGACLESLLTAADDGTELLVCDDASTDATAEVLLQLAERWPNRIKVHRNAINQGLSATRNRMIDVAQGSYLWFVDGDDLVLPGAVAQLRQVVEQHDPDIVLCDFSILRDRQRLKHRLRGEGHRKTFRGAAGALSRDRVALVRGLFEAGQLHAWSKIARRSLYGSDLRFPVGRTFEDQALCPRLALRAMSHIHVAEPWIAYRQREGSITKDMTLKKLDDWTLALEGFPAELEAAQGNVDEATRMAVSYQAAVTFVRAMRQLSLLAPPDASRWAETFRQRLLGSLAMPMAALQRSYLRRGWWWRLLKLRRALALAQDR
jgi:hypothetical protein